MAVNPANSYPGKISAPSDAYPYGEARNITTPGDGTGTPLEQAWLNDLWGFLQALLKEAGISPSGSPDTATNSQYFKSLLATFTPGIPAAVDITTRNMAADSFASLGYNEAGDGNATIFKATGVQSNIRAGTIDEANGLAYAKNGLEYRFVTQEQAADTRQYARNETRIATKVPKRVLYVGDSLTDRHTGASSEYPQESYTTALSQMLARDAGGYKEASYIALTAGLSSASKDFSNQINVSYSGFSSIWGASDSKWDEPLYTHSPDGRGSQTASSTTSAYIFVNTTGIIKATRALLYYLKQPNGGQLRVGYTNVAAVDRTRVATESPTFGLGVAEIDLSTYGSERIAITSSSTGKPIAVYGIQLIDDDRTDGFTYDIFARSGSRLLDHNNLSSMATYYQNIAPTDVIINIGTNDALRDDTRMPVAEFKTQLETWVDNLRAVRPNARIFIVEPNRPAAYYDADDVEMTLLRGYSAVRKEVAEATPNGVYVDLPLLAGDYKYFLESGYMLDALHPNSLGKYHIAKTMYDYLSFDVAPAEQLETREVGSPVAKLEKYGSGVSIGDTPVLIAKYGIKGTGVQAYFDLKVSVSFPGSLVTSNVQFYAITTVQADDTVYDVRGAVSSQVFTYNAVNPTATLTLTASKSADGYIEVYASTANWATAPTYFILSGTAMSTGLNSITEK